MKLKINRYEFEVTNKDYIMDNGAVYQCVTLKHLGYPNAGGRFAWITKPMSTIMSKKQFSELLKKNQLVLMDKEKYPKTYARHGLYGDSDIKLYRFNVE